MEPQEPAGGAHEETEEEEVREPVKLAPAPVLLSYQECADALGVAVETIRGAANGDRPRLTKYNAPENPRLIRVDLNEARRVINVQRAVAP